MSQSILNVRIAPSGQGIAFEAFQPDGVTPATITGFAGLDEVQSLTVSGTPGSQSFTLTVGGETTGPIPFQRVPVSTSFAYNVALPAAGTYDIQVCPPTPRGTPPVNDHAVYDGILPLGPPVAITPGAAVAGSYTDPSGAVFVPLGRYTFATTSASVEVSAALGQLIYMSALRLVPVGGGSPIIQVMTDPANTCFGQDVVYSLAGSVVHVDLGGYYGAGYYGFAVIAGHGTVQPTFWFADPAAVQSAITSLAGFSGACTATSAFFVAEPTAGVPTPVAPQVINLAYTGTKAATAIGVPTPSDPAVVAVVLHPGDQPIRYAINGGPSTPLGSTTATFLGASPESYFYAPLPQSDVYPGSVGGAYIATSDGYTFSISGQSLSGVGSGSPAYTGLSTYLSYGIGGSTMTWPLEGLPAGTYSLEITWPAIAWPAHFAYGGSCAAGAVSVLDKAANVLHTETIDQTAAPSGVADPARAGVVWHQLGSYTVTGAENRLHVTLANPTGTGLTVGDAVRLTRTSPDTSIAIGPNDVVTLDAPLGALLTAAGPSPAIVARVIPHAGTSFLPDPALTVPAIPVGWNAGFEDTFGANLGHANLAKRITTPGLDGVTAFDSHGYPTVLSAASGGRSRNLAVGFIGDGEANGPGVPVVPNDPAGVWSIWWDDASGGSSPPPDLTDSYYNPYPTTGTAITGQATGNRRYFNNVHDPRASCPQIGLILYSSAPRDAAGHPLASADGTYPCTIKNVHIYPPDPVTGGPWANPPVWHPTFSSRLGIGPIRCLDLTGAAASNTTQFSDTASPDDFSFNASPSVSIPIVSFANDPNAPVTPGGLPAFNPNIGATVRVTTAVPHGFNELDAVRFEPGPSGTIGLPTFTMNGGPLIADYSNGQSFDPGAFFDNYTALIHIISPTEFTFSIGFNRRLDPALSNYLMTNVVSPTGAVAFKGFSPSTPYADIVALGVESGVPLWIPIPTNANDDCITQIANLCLALPPGRPLYIEYSNETWNSYVVERSRFELLSYSMGLSTQAYDYVPSYMVRGKHCHDIFASVFAAQGRAGDIVRVFSSQQGTSSTTGNNAAYAVAHGIPVDAMAIAPYLEGCPLDALFAGIPAALLDRFNTYTVAQNLDLLELLLEYGPMRTTFGEHRAAIDATGLKRVDGSVVPMIAYEGGFETVIPGETIGYTAATATNVGLRTLAVLRHPRMYRISRGLLELAQAGGCELWVEYRFGDKLSPTTWDKVIGTYQGCGTGDASKDLANVAPFKPKASVLSEVAGAYRDWSRAVQPAVPKNPIPFHYFFQLAGGI